MVTLPLADEPAKVATFTADRLQYYPAPPMYWGLVQFANGARLLMEMVEVDPAAFDAGSPLRMVYRITQKDGRRGLHRYFWKAAPARAVTATAAVAPDPIPSHGSLRRPGTAGDGRRGFPVFGVRSQDPGR